MLPWVLVTNKKKAFNQEFLLQTDLIHLIINIINLMFDVTVQTVINPQCGPGSVPGVYVSHTYIYCIYNIQVDGMKYSLRPHLVTAGIVSASPSNINSCKV